MAVYENIMIKLLFQFRCIVYLSSKYDSLRYFKSPTESDWQHEDKFSLFRYMTKVLDFFGC